MKKLILIAFLFSAPAQAENLFADGPYLAMGEIVGTMATCAVLTPSDEPDKSSHCFVGMSAAFFGTIISANTGQKWWIGSAVGCGLGAIKELRDAQGYGTPEFADFAWTCLPAITTSIGLNGIINFYNYREMQNEQGGQGKVIPSFGIRREF